MSSQPPKAGSPFPPDLAARLSEAAGAALTADIAADRWAMVLDALSYSPVRQAVTPASIPEERSEELVAAVRRVSSRLPAIATLFGVAATAPRARRGSGKGGKAPVPPPPPKGTPHPKATEPEASAPADEPVPASEAMAPSESTPTSEPVPASEAMPPEPASAEPEVVAETETQTPAETVPEAVEEASAALAEEGDGEPEPTPGEIDPGLTPSQPEGASGEPDLARPAPEASEPPEAAEPVESGAVEGVEAEHPA
jgi:hypothetical protein